MSILEQVAVVAYMKFVASVAPECRAVDVARGGQRGGGVVNAIVGVGVGNVGGSVPPTNTIKRANNPQGGYFERDECGRTCAGG